MKTNLGFCLSRLFLSEKYEIPRSKKNYVGLVKLKQYILFEFDNNKPTTVWRRIDKGIWKSEPFVGYQLIMNYSIKEFKKKRIVLTKALKLHWTKVCNNVEDVHGDLTHFNILIDSNSDFHYIDMKPGSHSKLYDIYYFYAYLNQCIQRCTSIRQVEKNEIVQLLNELIQSLKLYSSATEYRRDIATMNIPVSSGLKKTNAYLNEFSNVLEKNFH